MNLIRAANKIAEILRRLGLLSFQHSADELLKQAKCQSKLTDFGDERFKDHLQALLGCFERDRKLTYTHSHILRATLKKNLVRRLFLERDLQEHPEISHVPVIRPVVIVGFPRSGTTLLQNLLLQHPRCRWIRDWELMTPFPREPGIWGSSNDPRIKSYNEQIEKHRKRFPELDVSRALDNPVECWELQLPFFAPFQAYFSYNMEKYWQVSKSISEEDWREIYSHYKRQIQHLSWYQPGCHWVLKCPTHLEHFGNLIEVFPDARIVQLHRDPCQFVSSFCHMTKLSLESRSNEAPSSQEIGLATLAGLSEWKKKALDFRKRSNSINFYDLHYRDLVGKPIETVRGIYDFFDMEFSGEMEIRLKRWLQENHGENHRRHEHNLDQFGLTPADIESEFKDYCQYFNVCLGGP